MVYFVLANLIICIFCLYLLDWSAFYNNQNNKLKFLLVFTILANLPFVNLFLLMYLILNREKV